MPAQPAKRWSADEARALNEANPKWWPRYEVVDGELLVSPAPRPAHQRAVVELILLLGSHLRGSKRLEVFPGPADLSLEPDSTLSPDVFVAPRGTDVKRFHHWSEIESLALVAEVLSPSTARNDRVTKRDYFMRNDVGEYWIVDLDARVIERWRHGEQRPEILTEAIEWRPDTNHEALTIVLTEFFTLACDE